MRLRGLGEDTGSESVGLAVLFPIVALLIFSAVQGGLWWYAHAVAAQAAQAGVDAGRPVGAATTTATEAARSFTNRAGRGVLSAPEVQAAVTVETVRVTVSGTAPRVLPIPGLDVRVEVSAQASKERFTVPLAAEGGGL
ncbi:TadE/TadG family type IV pilus assembly protein [Amycolatopsis pithecellobii]|uniref:Pilus assembly protein TadE n=1 Tax=Amycolatopsis pithecellobii TaxID=664692 RepID=A0A6N7Z7D8_9PSEU|nr:TadE/TadG family type IV pilus assembly protein [Amycolatopsis pithecellobii]MTD57131.1 pilus assembly protein TadE [Amycolatopsis pithecellobii]